MLILKYCLKNCFLDEFNFTSKNWKSCYYKASLRFETLSWLSVSARIFNLKSFGISRWFRLIEKQSFSYSVVCQIFTGNNISVSIFTVSNFEEVGNIRSGWPRTLTENAPVVMSAVIENPYNRVSLIADISKILSSPNFE